MKSREEKLGELGEKFVAFHFDGKLSEDMYDMKKDITLEDGTEIEVKTQVRWQSENSFVVYETKTNNNLKKCRDVDRLFFVEPWKNNVIKIYECVDRTFVVRRLPSGEEKYLFPARKMIEVASITNKKICDKMIEYSKTSNRYLSG